MGTRTDEAHPWGFGPLVAGLAGVAAVLVIGTAQAASVTLTEGRSAAFTDRANPGGDKARFTFKKDPALSSPLVSPLCPAESEIRMVTSNGSAASVTLDCTRWGAKGTTFRYRGNKPTTEPSGAWVIRYGAGRLNVRVKGGDYSASPVVGPADWVETTFTVDGQDHCGRWVNLRKNESDRITARGSTLPCEIVCGDGDLEEPLEECDDGNQDSGDGCGPDCRTEDCGDGEFTPPIEECDDGNADGGDGCSADCTLEACGNGILDVNEDCDDGGTVDGDCCSSTCSFETGACSDGSRCTEIDSCQGGVCVGSLIQPWLNEIDYDNFESGIIDREEFAEIAGPAGLDLAGYTLFGVEGADGSCLTPGEGPLSGLVLPGYVHWSVTLPPDTVLGDDTGTGIGFLVICNSPSSQTVIDDGNCDVIFPGISVESNFKNGALLNDPLVCPDGMLLLDPEGNLVDAVSYEGIVPNAGPLGAFFHIDPPYNAGVDEGWKPKVSLEKWTNDLGRAVSASEWRDSGGCSDQCVAGAITFQCDWVTGLDPCLGNSATPGALNSGGQQYNCNELFCGDGFLSGEEECDEGVSNSDAPDASCRTDCTLRRCGDGIVDPSAAPGFPESCETDGDCAVGETCAACQCAIGTPLGSLTYTVVPGSADLVPVDDGESTWMRINQPLPALLAIETGSNGQWTQGPLQFTAGIRGVDDVAPFYLTEKASLSSPLPALAGGGKVCVRVSPDHSTRGFIDCDGGSNADAELSIDSNAGGPADPSVLSVGGNPADSGAGAAVAYLIIESASTGDDLTPCEDAVFSEPIRTAVTTGVARSEILNGLVVGNVVVSLSGQPFDCSNWTTDAGASLAWPSYNLDVPIPFLGVQDVSQIQRLNDD